MVAIMRTPFSKETLSAYFYFLEDNLKTGTDRITAEKFKSDLENHLNHILLKVDTLNYKFTRLKKFTSNDRQVFIPTIRDRLVLECTKDNLKRKFKISIPNRNYIISNLKNVLGEKIDYYIVRLDITKFFASVPHDRLLNKLERTAVLNSHEFQLVKSLLSKFSQGLPAGIGLSNYLSELYLESFDLKLKSIHPRVHYYARYVDDIIIVITGKLTQTEKNDIQSKIDNIIKEYQLSLNPLKTKYIDFPNNKTSIPFDYLGYEFKRVFTTRPRNQDLVITICPKKLRKLRLIIDSIIADYNLNNNFDLLYERIIAFIYTNKINKIKAGIDKNCDVYHKKYKITYGLLENYKHASLTGIDKHLKWHYHNLKTKLSNAELRKLYSATAETSKRLNKAIIYENIPHSTLRSKVNKLNPSLGYRTIIRMNHRDLLKEYYILIHI